MGTLGCQHVRFILVLFSLAHNLHKAYAPLFCASEHTMHLKVYHPHPKRYQYALYVIFQRLLINN